MFPDDDDPFAAALDGYDPFGLAAEKPAAQAEPTFVAELNEPQARAVSHVDGPLLVFAGAGSGKTRVITYRIANLVATHRVPPYRILAVTFTNKAASEMKRRLEGLIGADITRDLWVGTFHAVCVRILRTIHDAAGLEKNFVIYDDGDQRALMNRIIKELKLDDKRYPPKQVLGRIHKEKQEGRCAADFDSDSWLDEGIAKCFKAYEEHLARANAVDFDDLLIRVLRVAEDQQSPVGESLRGKFSHVLVDEFQDVNQVQYRLVRALAGRTRNLCVVGDDDQSIYRWRGADVRNIRGFRRDFDGAEVVKLEQNYRSSDNVVKAALGVIRHAKDREPKELWTSNPAGSLISIVAAESERGEAAWVSERIRELVSRGTSPGDIAVFYRIHAQSRVLEEVLRAERIPYQIIGGTRFFERAEIKDFLSYLRVVTNPRSDVDLARIINVPSRKIGQTTLQLLIDKADQNQSSLYDALKPLIDGGEVRAAAKKSLLGFYDLLQVLMREARTASPRLLAEEVLERTGYKKHLESDDSVESDARLQNLEELVGSIAEYEEEVANAGEVATLSGYLERVTLQSATDTMEDAPKVAMMTVHAAKGLEFSHVFITGMEEEMFPFRGLDPGEADELEEERRLAYVAITRARKGLTMTHAQTRTIFGRTRYCTPSRFLGDLPAGVYKPVSTPGLMAAGRFAAAPPLRERPTGAWNHPQAQAFRRGMQAALPARSPGERFVERDVEVPDDGELHRGSQVMHPKYGVGVITELDDGSDPTATVRFSGGWGTKRIKASFLRGPQGE